MNKLYYGDNLGVLRKYIPNPSVGLNTLIKKKIGRYYTMESQILLSDESIVFAELRKRV